jgi:hypothetical protein
MSYEAIQAGLYTALTGDVPLMALVTGVHDHVQQGKAYPYVVIGDDEHTDWDTDDQLGLESTLTLHVWARAHRGRKSVKQIQDRIRVVLHHKPLTIAGSHHVLTVVERADSILDPDGLTQHGVQEVRTLTLET